MDLFFVPFYAIPICSSIIWNFFSFPCKHVKFPEFGQEWSPFKKINWTGELTACITNPSKNCIASPLYSEPWNANLGTHFSNNKNERRKGVRSSGRIMQLVCISFSDDCFLLIKRNHSTEIILHFLWLFISLRSTWFSIYFERNTPFELSVCQAKNSRFNVEESFCWQNAFCQCSL